MANSKKSHRDIEKEDVFQAVVVVDDFEGIFADYTDARSSALIPVANFYVVDYALECLGRCGFEETILFCSAHAAAIKDHIKKSPWNLPSSTMKITILISEKCQFLGDALRDIDHRAIIKGDFVLLSAFTVTNINLMDILKHHKQLRAKEKGTAMTMVLQSVGSRIPKLDNNIYVINAVSNRLLMHVNSSKLKKFEMPLERLAENVNMNIHGNLVDTGVAICSPSVPILFSDNFDFRTKEDFVHGVLINEEILDSRIYCYQADNGYGATIRNWQMFQRVSMDCIHRWTFPLVPDQLFTRQVPYSYYRNGIYKQHKVHLLNSVKLEMDVVVGAHSKIGQQTRIRRSVVGKNCTIGQNVVIRDSYVFDNSFIEDNCKIELSVVGEYTKVKENSRILKCFLKRRVVLNSNTQLEEVVVVSESLGKKWEKLGENAYSLKVKTDFGSDEDLNHMPRTSLVDPEAECIENNEEEEVSSVSDADKSYTQSPEPDDTTVFYTEVVDSLQRGFEEKLSCDNLILEINSSRYAYNVTLSDVTVLTLKGILLLPPMVKSTSKAVLMYFLPLLKNYVKTSEAQMECLELMEGLCEELGNDVAKCLHFLYDSDILSEESILKWHKELEKDSPVIPKVAPLIKWLQEAAEESSSEEST